jgi:hypothetical protein
MSIRPVDFNGMIQRTQDIGNMKHQEDSKPVVQQHNIAIQQEKQEEKLLHQVQDTNEKENDGYRYDAKEKGNNSYEGNPNQRKKKKQEQEKGEDGRVIVKSHVSRFDIKI